MSLAAVQARIAQIQGQFAVAAPVAVTATPPAAAPASFSATLAAQTAKLAATGVSGPAATTTTSTASTASTAGATGAMSPATAHGDLGEQVVALAKTHLGTPYVWGGNQPGGFDCSGLLQWSYKQLGIDIPRVSNDQAKGGREVSAAEARPGDLVFFERGRIDHIGMYAGAGQWVVAPKTGDVVKMQDVDLSKATTIRRYTPDSALPTAAPSTAARAGGAAAFSGLFTEYGAKHGVSAALLTAVARAESGFNPAARSPAGAQGLMQFMPATAKGLGIDPWNPAQAVDGAARLLKQNLERFGSTELALAAYNAGPGAVTKHGGIPPYRETQDYVAKIMREVRGAA